MGHIKNKTGILALPVLIAAMLAATALALSPAPNINPARNSNTAGVGSGVLYVYMYPDGTDEAPLTTAGNYLVTVGVTYCFKIAGITEYENTKIQVWATYANPDEANALIGTFHVDSKPSTIEFDWPIPLPLPIDTSIKFKYGTTLTGPSPSWYFAKKAVEGSPPRLLLVIPWGVLGTLGAGTAFFAALGFRTILRKTRD